MSHTVLIYAIVLVIAALTLRWIISAFKRNTPTPAPKKAVTPNWSDIHRVWVGEKRIVWRKESGRGHEQKFVRSVDEKEETILSGGSIEVCDAFWGEWWMLFIRHTQGDDEQLYAIHKKNPTELQLLGTWPTNKSPKVKAFRKPTTYYGGYYREIPPILYQSDGVQLIRASSSGAVMLELITDSYIELLLTQDIENAIDMILDIGDGDVVENIDELECANAIDFIFTIRHGSKDLTNNIDVYRLRFKDLKIAFECLHKGCSEYEHNYRGQFFVIVKDGLVSMHRRLTNEAVASGFDASQSWAYDKVKIDNVWHYAFIGVKDGVCIAQVNDLSKHVALNEGAVEICIINDEAFYQLERTVDSKETYDLYRFSDQQLLASFYEVSSFLNRNELSSGEQWSYYECGCEPTKIPHHALTITLGNLAKDPSLLQKLRPSPDTEEDNEDSDALPENEVYFE